MKTGSRGLRSLRRAATGEPAPAQRVYHCEASYAAALKHRWTGST
jgi:hypothetical protein